MKLVTSCAILMVALAPVAMAGASEAVIEGNYIETRSCDVWVAACFANGEVNTAGKEATMTWDVTKGSWNGVALDGLKVVAVLKAQATLGDPSKSPLPTKSIVLVDERANEAQKAALIDFAREASDGLVDEIVDVRTMDIAVSMSECAPEGCATVTAGDVLEIAARCLHDHDKHCGNEVAFYPPLTDADATAHFAKRDRFSGEGLGVTWDNDVRSSAYIGTFSR
jgi:hypothetical protein